MQRPILCLGVVLAIALGVIVACGGGDKPPDPEPSLLISANPRQINDQGQASQITVTATNADETAGTGTVTLKAVAGALGNSAAEETLTLSNGKATTSFTCNKTADSKCAGNVRIDGTWNTATASTTLTVGSSNPPPLDGGPDGGPPRSDGGVSDGGTDGGYKVTVTTSKPTIFTQVGDVAEITASLTMNGSPQAGAPLTFETTLGGLQITSTDTPTSSVEATTDGTGKALVRFVETGTEGNATIRAHHTSGAQASVAVKVTRIQQITHQSTQCGGQACTIMGVRGSGFNEQAQVAFKVVDSSGQPVPGLTVTFSIPNPPTGTTVSPSAVTNALGIATATVSAGPVIGAIVVHAVAVPNQVQVDSPNIGIRGAKVSNQGFSFSCAKVNLPAYTSPNPPAVLNVDCRVKVVDRYNNPVGTGTTVNFKTEAGNIPNSVQTKPYSPSGSNTDEGTGTVTFNTAGGTFPPVDVDPLEADPNQFPIAREAETRGALGQLTVNPRDNFVTVIAYTRGEEWFDDRNSNGTRDTGEQFIDQGEPFVDSNDNGVYDLGEQYIDEAPADGQWNGPNGTWDNNTTIWTETRLIFTGPPAPSALPAPFSRRCSDTAGTVPLPKGQTQNITVYYWDQFFNVLSASTVTISASHTATKGSVSVAPGTVTLLDDYGFGYDRRLFSTADGRACVATSPSCVWKVYFTTWWGGAARGTITGAPTTDTTACQDDNVTFSVRMQPPTAAGSTITTGALE